MAAMRSSTVSELEAEGIAKLCSFDAFPSLGSSSGALLDDFIVEGSEDMNS